MKLFLAVLILSTSAHAGAVFTGSSSGGLAGPSSTTQNAFSLWDSTDGSLLKNSKLLLDETAMGTGTATFKPTTGTTSRTYTLPDITGEMIVNGAGQSFGDTFMAESLQWFNNSDTSKRMKFDLTNVHTSATTKVTWNSSGCAPASGVCTIAFPPFDGPTGSPSSMTLASSWHPTIGKPYFYYWFDLEDSALYGSEPSGDSLNDPYVDRIYKYNTDVFLKHGDGSKVNLTGTVVETRGGTNQTTYALGDILYSSASNTLSKLSGNTTTTKKYLNQTGNGTISAAPVWSQPSTSDFTEGSNLFYTNARGIGSTLTGWSSGAGTVGSSDTVLQGLQKLDGNDNAMLGQYSTLMEVSGSHTAAKVAGTYALGHGDVAAVSGTGTLYPIQTIYIDSADYPTVNGKAAKLRIRAQLYTNDVAPTGNYTFGLYPITRPATSGGAGIAIYTIGTVVSGSNGASFTTPAADGLLNAVGSDFALPANGHYVIAVATTATVATSAHVHLIAKLQIRYN